MNPCYQGSFLLTGSLISLHINALHRNSALWPDPEVLSLWAWRSDRVWAVGLPSAWIWWVLKKALSNSLGLWSIALFSWEFDRKTSLRLHAFFCSVQVGKETTFPGPHDWGWKLKAISEGEHHIGVLYDRRALLLFFPVPGKWVGQLFLFCERLQARAPNVKVLSWVLYHAPKICGFFFPTSTNQPAIMYAKLVTVFDGSLRTLSSNTLVSQQLDASLCCLL